MTGGPRVVVGVTGSVGNLQALRRAMAEARLRGAGVLAVHAWLPPGGELAERRLSVPELRQVWHDAAWRRVWDAFDAAFGGLPPEIQVEVAVTRGEPGQVLVNAACQDNDLLVIGTGRGGALRRLLPRRVCRYCLTRSACPVLVVPPSALAREMEHRWRAWLVRRWALLPGRHELTGHPG